MSAFLPLLDNLDSSLTAALVRLGPVILSSSALKNLSLPSSSPYIAIIEADTDADDIVTILDNGAQAVVVTLSQSKELLGRIPSERLILLLDAESVSAISDKVRNAISGVLLKTVNVDVDFVGSITKFFTGSSVYVLGSNSPTPSAIRASKENNTTLVIPASHLTLGPSSSSQINIADAFLAPLSSDRPDGLFPTLVSSHDQGGRALGLVYSSKQSISESIITGRGVYQSRKHGLWRKGETSGAIQEVIRITLDCDSDALEFSVLQHGSGFCHTGAPSCFRPLEGLSALESTLKSRLHTAPEGSYTRRLFDDPDLLHSKIGEEADELCRAESQEEIAFEAADLLYFILTKCISKGVTLSDIETSLDAKAKKVTRRTGNAKPPFETHPPSSKTVLPTSKPQPVQPTESGRILMQTFDLATSTPLLRASLLKRPVLNSHQMLSKVQPIVDEVRSRGDVALLEFTAKFDKVQMSEIVLFPPFPQHAMDLEHTVREAIDVAYANIKKFHEAQVEKVPLIVETMPGVVCSRFSRPIARVGLYVPGGTAILPSTALMLGIPAQVAGCKEIVLATPPRPDGTISPEVMYVAHRIGASAIVKAGGAQAVAALAYGTQTVPKVDKIFGPGNQWVTAAKMFVQNDTDALVSIDMPAGPSEVLVIADSSANSAFVAADLLSQAEHGIDSQVVLVALDLPATLLSSIEEQIDLQAKSLPRVDVLRVSIAKSLIVKVHSLKEALDFSNDYCPEHLILHVQNAKDIISKVENAGSVFIGPWSPESFGDYASGTNHTLPTNGYARQFSGVNTLSFLKHITAQEITQDGLRLLGPVVTTLADCEGLQAHANAVRIRLNA